MPNPIPVKTESGRAVALSPSRSYKITTGVYTFSEQFTRSKLVLDELTQKSKTVTHKISRTGEDRLLRLADDNKTVVSFCDRPKVVYQGVPESQLWEIFERPVVKTVKELFPRRYERNMRVMNLMEMMGQFTYYPGQRDYYARLGCKNSALIAAEVGTGKTLGALSLVAMQAPRRTLIVAPQGTMRTPGGDTEDFDNAAQWVQEIRKFAPTEPVFQLFNRGDYEKLIAAHKGKLPDGIYISYPHAMFSNQSFDHLPKSWEKLARREVEQRFRNQMKGYVFKGSMDTEWYHVGVGTHSKAEGSLGIHCVATPNLATRIGDVWDMVILDEAHLISNLATFMTRNVIRLRAKYRYAMTATPIPNIVTDIFPLMGWLSVDDWFLNRKRNAQWPYAVKDFGSFAKVFMAQERDHTQEALNRIAGKKNTRCVRPSAIISSPARLLKLIKPTLAFINKIACNPKMVPCSIKDVRVPLGKDQAKLYELVLDPSQLPYTSALTRARVHSQVLRGVCAHPKTTNFHQGVVHLGLQPQDSYRS